MARRTGLPSEATPTNSIWDRESSAAAPLVDLAGETVERMTAETAFKANVAVLKTADEMYGSLLDILA